MQLRVIDAGVVNAARSQSLWHGIATAMQPESAPVLSLCHPGQAYVCLGYHHPLGDIDTAACRRRGLPVLRRQIGGGPVYIDADQLFFQLTVPAARAPTAVSRIYAAYLAPALAAFRALGLRAQLRGDNDIAVGDRKVSGTGAGRIGEAVTVVGNILFRFPAERMAEVLALPSEEMRREYLRLMRRHVTSLHREGIAATVAQAKEALIAAYAGALDLCPGSSDFTAAEAHAVARWEQRFAEPRWLAGVDPTAGARPHRVKICAGVWLIAARGGGRERIEATVVDGRVVRARLHAPGYSGAAVDMERALCGARADRVDFARRLARFGATGAHFAALLAQGLPPQLSPRRQA